MAVAEKSFSKALAFAFLKEIQDLFIGLLKTTYGRQGVNYGSIIETIEKPYQFAKMDKEVQKKVDTFNDSKSDTLQKLQTDLSEVNKILTEDFELMMDREKNLNSNLFRGVIYYLNNRNERFGNSNERTFVRSINGGIYIY